MHLPVAGEKVPAKQVGAVIGALPESSSIQTVPVSALKNAAVLEPTVQGLPLIQAVE